MKMLFGSSHDISNSWHIWIKILSCFKFWHGNFGECNAFILENLKNDFDFWMKSNIFFTRFVQLELVKYYSIDRKRILTNSIPNECKIGGYRWKSKFNRLDTSELIFIFK